MSTQKFFVDQAGNYIGCFVGAEPPYGSIEVSVPPTCGTDKWNGESWVKSRDSMVAVSSAAIQTELDRVARSRGYDSIVSACSYAAQSEGAPFQAEGAAFLAWRSAVWANAYAVLAEVEAGNRALPTPEEAVSMMPTLSLPS